MYTPYPGDLIFVRSSTILGSIIRWFTRSKNEEKTYANHVAGMGFSGILIEALITVVSSSFLEWKKYNHRFEIWRNKDLSDSTRAVIAHYVDQQIGRKYGFLKLGLHAGDAILAKLLGNNPYFFRRLAFVNRYPICSWLWAYAYFKGGIKLGGSPNSLSPDDMYDYVKTDIVWELIYKEEA